MRQLDDGQADVGKAALGGASSFALWENAGTPGFEQCREASLAQGVARVSDVGLGAVLCVRTNKDHVARLTVKKIDTGQGPVTFDAVIWDAG